MSRDQNPYKDKQAEIWDEGYDVCENDMIDELTEMSNALREARRYLDAIHDWKVRIINGKLKAIRESKGD